MKQILTSLNKNLVKVTKLVDKRYDIYNRRTEKWKESKTGIVYESDTIELDCVKDNIEEAVKSLEELIDV